MEKSEARPYVVVDIGPAADAPVGSQPMRLYGDDLGGGGGGTGPDSPYAIGRKILNIEGGADLGAIPDIAEYSFVDIRGEASTGWLVVNLPRAEDYGEGRIITINDKLGHVDGDTRSGYVQVVAHADDGIDGANYFRITERNGFVQLRATKRGPQGKREWQVVGVNSPATHVNSGFANWQTGNMDVGKGYRTDWMGAHVYVPIMFELYPEHAVNKFWVRYYPTGAMANADKDRAFGDPVPAGVHVSAEFVVGGDMPARSYGEGRVVSSWDPNGKGSNTYFAVATLVEGTPGRLSAHTSYKNMVVLQ